MTSTQQFLVIGGMVLLSLLALNFYRASDIQYDMKYENEATITATSIAQSIFEEMNTKAFDEKCIGKTASLPDSLTAKANLGKDAGENDRSKFDDIDDYNGYLLPDSSMGLGKFDATVLVNYVVRSDPNTVSVNPTFTKRATIFVSNGYLKKGQLEYSYAFSY